MLRSLPLLALALLTAACAPAATSVPTANQFVLTEPERYKTATERELAQQFAENDCKAKALAAGATVQKAGQSDHSQRASSSGDVNLGATIRTRRQSDEMYAATFTACMNKAGFLMKPAV
ncbi:hypothetical protein [Rhodomicrobium udaipurense]|uniref:Uncharacterized protein n=1 Tax=Rhodomicrobium udaipurense TaxID=1202716 RepID=A0A8I1KH21_9HYPH|nr:hypothetical protein [Rhodomicrobium udaipurense]MBJ7543295.1 hypothetical protein [Rhodomicrobium udaipurense]